MVIGRVCRGGSRAAPTIYERYGTMTRLFLLGIVWLLLVGCAAPAAMPAANVPATPTPSAEPSPRAKATPVPRVTTTPTPESSGAEPTISVVLQRSGGFAGRSEVFVLKPDGTVTTAFGELHAPGGAAAALALTRKIAATNILSVPPGEYLPANGCCDRYLFDLTLTLDGKAYHYVTLEGNESAPAPLRETIASIQAYISAAQ